MGRIPTTVGLARGEGLVARFGDVVIFLDSESTSTERILGAAETAAGADDPGVAIAQRLAATVFSSGSAHPPNFGVIAPTAGGILVLLRGPVRALAEGPEGAHRLSGERAMTWTDEILRDPVRRLTVTADADKAIPHTDLRSGVVPAGGFVVLAPVSGLAAQSKSGSGASSRPGTGSASGSTPAASSQRSGSRPIVDRAAAETSGSGAIPQTSVAEEHPAPDTTRRAPIPTPSRSRFNIPSSNSEPVPRAADSPGARAADSEAPRATTDSPVARAADSPASRPGDSDVARAERGRSAAERAAEVPSGGSSPGSQHTTADLSDVAPAFAQTVGVFPDFPGGAAPSGPAHPPGSSRTDATTPAPQNGTTGERARADQPGTSYAGPTTPAASGARGETPTGGTKLGKPGTGENATTQRRAPVDPPAAASKPRPSSADSVEPAVTQRDNRPSPDEQPATAAFDALREASEPEVPEPKPSRQSGKSRDVTPPATSRDSFQPGRSGDSPPLAYSRDSGPLGQSRDSAPIGAPGARPGSSDRNPVVGPPETTALTAIGALTSSDGAVYPLDRPYVIGRDPMIDESVRRAAASPIVIPRDRHVSRVHAHITIENNTIFVRDAGTPGGTFVAAPGAQDWIRVGQRAVELKPGWSLRVGGRVLTFRVEQPR